MFVLSFDVGIKHLAYVLIKIEENNENDSYTIEKWDILDLCKSVVQKCLSCSKNASFAKENRYYCRIHAKKHPTFLLPSHVIKGNKLQKRNIQELKQIANEFHISSKKETKSHLIKNIKDYYKSNTFETIEKPNANDFDLISLGIAMKDIFHTTFLDYEINKVYIENQISPIANRMKSVQAMMTQYFIMTNCNDIQYISSINKLKIFKETTNNYKERKKLGIEKTIQLLKDDPLNHIWIDFFQNHKKKDDLADAFLQFYYMLKKQ